MKFARFNISDYMNNTADVSFLNVTNAYMHQTTDPSDTVKNLWMPGIDTEDYCYRICLVTNNGVCTLFRYGLSSKIKSDSNLLVFPN